MEVLIETNSILKSKIKNLSELVWENKITWDDVQSWLSNFDTEEEKTQMLFLLSQFMYFGDKEIRELLKAVYRDKYKYKLIHNIRKDNKNSLDKNLIQDLFEIEKNKTLFFGVGNPSESGTHLLYFFRQENKISKKLFINTHEITHRLKVEEAAGEKTANVRYETKLKHPDVKHYIFIDDLCGSGDQVTTYSENIVNEIKTLNPEAIISYYALFAMKKGIEYAKNNSEFDNVEAVYEFDESFSCFSDNSRHFKNVKDPISKELSMRVAEKYGNNLFHPPLGHGNCQLLVGFQHNTPDNTLPVLWFDGLYNNKGEEKYWTPIFKRYNKIY